MPRNMPPGLMLLLARADKQIETHTTLQVSIDNGDILRDYRFASARVTISGVTYEPQLRRGSSIASSLTRSADSASVELQNVDTELGKEFLGLGQALYGAEAKIGRYWRDTLSGAEFHKVFQTGVIVSLEFNEKVARITAVSEPYANISVGASRRVARSCQWTFRDPSTCQYAGSLLVCNFRLNDDNGCNGRHGDPLKRAKFGGFVFLDSGSRLKTI